MEKDILISRALCDDVISFVQSRTENPMRGVALLIATILVFYGKYRPDVSKRQMVTELAETILLSEIVACEPQLATAPFDETKPN
jgi:hypothetical protein